MGLPVSELDDLTFRQFQNKMDGFFEWHEQLQRVEWERQRIIAAVIINHNGMLKRGVKPEKMLPFAWDKKETKPKEVMSREHFEAIKNRMKPKD